MSEPVTFDVVHRTAYRYARPMNDGYTVAHLLPRETPVQRVLEARVEVDPEPDEQDEHVDGFGNHVVRIGLHRPHEHLVVTGRSRVEVATLEEVPEAMAAPAWDAVAALAAAARGDLAVELGPQLATTPATAVDDAGASALDALVGDVFVPGRPIGELVEALSARLHGRLAFDPGFTDVSTPVAEVVAAQRGVCQDFAHLLLAALRGRGLAARYVSGYIETEPPPGQVKLVGTDASHAWCSVWTPGGWLDVDPTNDQVPPRRHVTVAWGRDYHDVAPVRGVVIGPPAEQTLTVGVDVTSS